MENFRNVIHDCNLLEVPYYRGQNILGIGIYIYIYRRGGFL